MKIVVLDAATLGEDIDLSPLSRVGEVSAYASTSAEELADRISDCEIIVVNKFKLNASNLGGAKNLKLICLAATGFDNIDVAYCRTRGIGVCNVVGYSTHSVAQLTVAMALSLVNHIPEYNSFVESGEYSDSGIANRLTPVYHELYGMTWGIVGYGNIGKQVARVAEAFGCRVIANKRTPVDDVECVDIDTLCRESDIITVHTPLTDATRGLIGKEQIAKMKKSAILVNVARGAVVDEAALAEAVRNGEIAGIGIDVYSTEPFPKDHPYYEVKHLPNVCLTPHMAWGAYEARVRCIEEICLNIKTFYSGDIRCRVDL